MLEKKLSTLAAQRHWQLVKTKPHHGINIPLFSLRSKTSSGIGEYLDLILLIDFCSSVNMDVIQLLPLNEMGHDFSPYNAISSVAIDPIYISLANLNFYQEDPILCKSLKSLQRLNKKNKVNYEVISKKKRLWLKRYHLLFFDYFKQRDCYKTFLNQNLNWLEEYALFKYLYEKNNYSEWETWPEKEKSIKKEVFKALIQKYQKDLEPFYFFQYLSFMQMFAVKKHAQEKKVLIKGDIPILVNKNSADVWNNRSLFDLSHVVGSPPHLFNKVGQKWGFPLFHWPAHEKDNYLWWRRRLNVASSMYHLYRIDHAAGFFRIWAIKHDDLPSNGKYIPAKEELWGKEGEERLKMLLSATEMLPIAEDLGRVPRIVPKVLKDLGICSTKVLIWEKINKTTFRDIHDYEPLSITMLGTHDNQPLSVFWKERKQDAILLCKQKNWRYKKALTKEMRLNLLKDAHQTTSIFHINLLYEYLALFNELSYKNPKKDRINTPGTVSKNNWSWKMKPFIEDLNKHTALKKTIKNILSSQKE